MAEASASAEAAEAVLSRLRWTVKDAYVKRCDARTGTLPAWDVSAVDESIADVPQNTTIWYVDWVSSARPLPDGRVILVVRYFAEGDDGPRESRGERVLLASSGGNRLPLQDHCAYAGGFAAQDGLVAFHCSEEWAADVLFRGVFVFDGALISSSNAFINSEVIPRNTFNVQRGLRRHLRWHGAARGLA